MSLRWIVVVFLAACAHPHAHPGPGGAARTGVAEPKVGVPAAAAPEATPRHVDFARDVRPILESRCQPCHFSGGRMYDRLPFDREETIKSLGTKLFTRIKAEHEQAVIREFLAIRPHQSP